jgi:hypothetical protein
MLHLHSSWLGLRRNSLSNQAVLRSFLLLYYLDLLVGINVYPRVEAQLKQLVASGPPHDLQRLVQDALERAQALGISLTYRSISEQIGISIETLRGNLNSQVRAIIQRAQSESRELRENELVNRVEQAIEELLLRGEKVSLDKVGQIVGRNYTSLYRRPHIRERVLSLR